MKRVLITGITGMDGSILAEKLLNEGYKVYGLVRRSSTTPANFRRIHHLLDRLELIEGDLTDQGSLIVAIRTAKPDEIYNLAAQSQVRISFEEQEHTMNVTGLGVGRMLFAAYREKKDVKFYQASSSEMFGDVLETPQTEKTPFNPVSPYGVAKEMGHRLVNIYRKGYNMFACSGILFNHEGSRRGFEFVTRKISRGVAEICYKASKIMLGNLDAKRDWGSAQDYIEAMYLMLQQDRPDDYVIATGETHTVREFVEKAFKVVNVDIDWIGKGLEEKGIDRKSGRVVVEIAKEFYRPAEVDLLLGDASKARQELGWKPEVTFDELIQEMVENDLTEVKRMYR